MILKPDRDIVNIVMGKKRKTRQQKIITQLKRKLAAQQQFQPKSSQVAKISQEAISSLPQPPAEIKQIEKNQDKSIFFYDPNLVKRDLLKTFVVSLVIFSLQVVLYLKLR